MLAVGFDEEDVLVFAKGGLDEDIAEFGLKRGVQVQFGLFDGDQALLRARGVDKHRQQLADACATSRCETVRLVSASMMESVVMVSSALRARWVAAGGGSSATRADCGSGEFTAGATVDPTRAKC